MMTETVQTVTVTPACETASGSLSLQLSDTEVTVGEIVTVTVTLQNEGCLAMGLPQYRLAVQAVQGEPFEMPEPVVHSLAVAPESKDAHVFMLHAEQVGEFLLSAHASFEVHVGYPGPAYWGAASSGDPVRLYVLQRP